MCKPELCIHGQCVGEYPKTCECYAGYKGIMCNLGIYI